MMPLTAPEIISLIEACSTHRVAQFKAGEVEFTFGWVPSAVAAQAPSQTEEFAQTLRDARDWMEQDLPPPEFPAGAFEAE